VLDIASQIYGLGDEVIDNSWRKIWDFRQGRKGSKFMSVVIEGGGHKSGKKWVF
jgi:hypothetical protein